MNRTLRGVISLARPKAFSSAESRTLAVNGFMITSTQRKLSPERPWRRLLVQASVAVPHPPQGDPDARRPDASVPQDVRRR
jgi:hypothetical protein